MRSVHKQWVWLDPQIIYSVHEEQLTEHGGLAGIRDKALLESALGRPQNLANYDEPDVADLAASYGLGIAKNHPFIDGNKRTAYVACELFLVLNGYRLESSDADSVITMLQVAAGDLAESEFAAWIRQNILPR